MESKKSFGQNFLMDQQVVEDLINAAEIRSENTVLEVGAGTGTVTRALARRAGKVIAVELDRDLIPTLKENLKDFPNVEIVNADILQYIDTLKQTPNPTTFNVVGSIPYQITSPLIHRLLVMKQRPKAIALIVQKEVAEKIVAAPPRATYLSNFVANFGEAKIIKIIKPGSFRPQPKVESAIIRIQIYDKPNVPDHKRLVGILHRGFTQPRKMLKHNFPTELLEKTGIPSHLRPASLSKEDWRNLYRELSQTRERSKSRRGVGTWRY